METPKNSFVLYLGINPALKYDLQMTIVFAYFLGSKNYYKQKMNLNIIFYSVF